MSGNIILSFNKKGLVPRIIKYITKSAYSHSAVTTPDILGVPMIVEAADTGVGFKRFDTGYQQNPNEDFVEYQLNLPQDVKDEAMKRLFDDLQVEYGYLELLWFIWRATNKFFGRDIKGQDNWVKRGIICSELCRMYLTYCGLGYLFEGFGEGSLHAEDLHQIMQANPDLFIKAE